MTFVPGLEDECGLPGWPHGGNVTVSGGVAEYTCSPGHVRLGPGSRRCADTGTWQGHVPLCSECRVMIVLRSLYILWSLSSEPNLAWSGEASQSHVLWSYGPELAKVTSDNSPYP